MEITIGKMIEKVRHNVEVCCKQANESKSGSFAQRGCAVKEARATRLLNRLLDGKSPTTKEVVAYFGKGARFVL
jgi:hypothetical protein